MTEPTILIDETFASDLARVAGLPQQLEEARTRCSMSDTAFHNLLLTLTEAVTNAIVHGNRRDPERTVKVFVASRGELIICYVEDQGDGFEPSEVADPVAPENLLKDCGRGLFIIRSLSEKFRVDVMPSGTALRFSVDRGLGSLDGAQNAPGVATS